MADEEQQPVEGDERPKFAESAREEYHMPAHAGGDENEAKKAMEEAKRKKLEKQQQELAEYEEMRREEREKEAEEIAILRERRLQRKKEREEEEKKLALLRAQEDARMKAEAEERKRKKAEEEIRLKAEKERKKLEAEERLSMAKKPNFVITKRSDSDKAPGSDCRLDPLSAEDMQKSKEQLEEEKRAILSQRIQPLTIEGMASDKLLIKAKELNETIRRLVGDKYDLEQRFKRQQYDMIELAERARQMNKGKGKRGVSTVQVDESFDRLADKFTSAPPKIQLCSKYERHTDHRTYNERQTLFETLAVEPSAPEIQHVPGWKPPTNEPVQYGSEEQPGGEEQAAE